ncbi:preprotein translocase subunit SecE [Silvibacterium bohemicum]|jgi:preprotein translocase subunit SecE|uniref:Protein translocase subunit SecE n=1 Tax=Silvibacterium bohemicum TaxID=1577686 RepID=A0A841JXE5_9BACT|nr:preprotein translocase subunit SecE [Silvibacterium bohemicum]MBB6145820.1 preprotein translocase subunit SecE [Silvibacterium bohemicum]
MAKAIVASDQQERSGAQQGMQHVTGLVTRTREFLKDVRGEMRKVVTPSRDEVRTTTTVVILTVFAFAGFFYVVDSVLDHALRALLHSLGSTQ